MRGPVPLLIAIMTFVMVVVAAAGLALAEQRVGGEVGRRASLFDPDRRWRGQGAAADRRRPLAAPGVIRVEQVPPDDLRRTLERWLGPAGGRRPTCRSR